MTAMAINAFSLFVIDASIVLPAILFVLAWRRDYPNPIRTLLAPTLSALLLLSAVVHDFKAWFIGSDYSHRLYMTIELNVFLAIIAAIYFVVRKRWLAGLAALIVAADWMYMAVINSAV
jgi:hypothetical protein